MVPRSERRLAAAPNWLPDDTEESVLGTGWHQEAVHILADMPRDVARKREEPWGIYEQVELSGVHHDDGRPYPLHPDVFVVAQSLDPTHDIRTIALIQAGAPLFVAEVASRTTVKNDLRGKLRVYAAIGVAEYLVFDPTGDIMGTQLHAWRGDPDRHGHYQTWEPDSAGCRHSLALNVSLRPHPRYLLMWDRDGEEIGLPVDNAARARAAARALADAREAAQHEMAARLAAEEELYQLRARLAAENDGHQDA